MPQIFGARHIIAPDIFPSEEEMEDMTCDQVILWAIESFDIAHRVKYHDCDYQKHSLGKPVRPVYEKTEFEELFAESVFDMHKFLNLKCGCNTVEDAKEKYKGK